MVINSLSIVSAIITIITFICSIQKECMISKFCARIYFIFPLVFAVICFKMCVITNQSNLYKFADRVVRNITKEIGNEMPAHSWTGYCYVIIVAGVGLIYWQICNSIPVVCVIVKYLLDADILVILLAFMVLLITSVRYNCDVYESLRRTMIISPSLGIVACLIEIVIILMWCRGIK